MFTGYRKKLSHVMNDLSMQNLTSSSSNGHFPFSQTEHNLSNAFNTIGEAHELNGLYSHPKGINMEKVDRPNKKRKIMLFKKYNISSKIPIEQVKTTQNFLNQTLIPISTQRDTSTKSSINTQSMKLKNLYPLSPHISISQLEYKTTISAMKKIKKNKMIFSTINTLFAQCQIDLYQQQIQEYNQKCEPVEAMNLPRISPIYKSPNDKLEDGQKKGDGFSRDSYFANKYYHTFLSGFSRCKPSSRALSSITHIISDYSMYLIGGINSDKLIDIWKCELRFNKETECKIEWMKLNLNEEDALPRMGHSGCLHNNKIWIFGGRTDQHIPFSREDILSYNIKTNEIKNETCHNKTLSVWRKYHTANVIGNSMVVIGGISDNEEFVTEVNVLDFNTLRWSYLSMEKGYNIPPVAYHSSCIIIPFEKLYHNQMGVYRSPDNQRVTIPKIKFEGLYYFGGKNKMGDSNELRVIRVGKRMPDLITLKCHGMPPTPRHSSSITFHESFELLIIYGGKNDNNTPSVFDNAYVMNLYELAWIKVTLFGLPPQPRAEHCACIIDKALVIFGGSNNEGYLSSDFFIINLDYFTNKKLYEDYEFELFKRIRKKEPDMVSK